MPAASLRPASPVSACIALILLAAAARASAQGWTVPPGKSIKISGVTLGKLTEMCKLVACPFIPYGEAETASGISIFMPVSDKLKATAGDLFFRPEDWSLRLVGPGAPGKPFPVDLLDFHEEHAELGNGLIGDQPGEGVNLFFPVPPHVWEAVRDISIDLILTNRTLSTYTFTRLGRDSLPLFRLCQGADERRGEGFERRFYPIVERDRSHRYSVDSFRMVAGDGDGDGDIDLFLHYFLAPEIVTLSNVGHRRFRVLTQPYTPSQFELASYFGGGDLDRDGNFDLVMANLLEPALGDIRVFPGLGEGGFGTSLAYPAIPGTTSNRFQLVDLNSDGHLDLVSALDYESSREEIGVFLGGRTSGFRAGRAIPAGFDDSGWVELLALDDLNGDGRIDVATFNDEHTSDGLAILIGDGRGSFVRRPEHDDSGVSQWYRDSSTGGDALTSDFDADGDADLAVGMGRKVSVLINRGDATFLAPRILETRETVWRLQAADLDLDGDQDVAVSCWYCNRDESDTTIMLFLNDGSARFTPGGELGGGEFTRDLIAADMDADGDQDLALSELTGFSVWENLAIGPPRPGDPRLDIIAQAAPSGTSGLSPTLFDGQRNELSAVVTPGARGTATFYIALVSDLALAGTGIQGWSLLASVSDDLEITGITTSGTAADGAEHSVAQAGELITIGTEVSQGRGLRSEVFLAFHDASRTLPPTGTATVLKVTVRTRDELREGDEVRGRVTWQDDFLFRPSGSDGARGPYANNATVAGHGLLFCQCPGLDIKFRTFGAVSGAAVPNRALEAAGVRGGILPRLCETRDCPPPVLTGESAPSSMEGFSLLLPFGPPQVLQSRKNLVFRPGDWALELFDPNEPARNKPLLELTDFHEDHLELGSEILGDQPGEGINLFFPVDPKTWSGIADRSLTLLVRNLTGGKPNESSYLIDRLFRGGPAASRLCAIEDGESRLDAMLQKEPSAPQGLSPTLFAGQADEILVPVPPGEVGEATFHVALVSQLPPRGPGIQAWRLFAGLKGDIDIVSVTADGIAAGAAEHFFSAPGELLDATTGASLGPGFTTGATLGSLATLPPVGTATVLRVTVRTRGPVGLGEQVRGRVDWVDGARLEHVPKSGNAYDNVITVYSESHRLCTCRGADIVFVGGAVPFRRGDANGDGGVDISDAVRVLDFLFAGGAAPDCPDAADANDDAEVDISDAVRTLNFLFLGAAAPPAPGAFACGHDPTSDELAPCRQVSCS